MGGREMKRENLVERLPVYLDQLAADDLAMVPPPEVRQKLLEEFERRRHSASTTGQQAVSRPFPFRLGDLVLLGRGWVATGLLVAVVLLVAGISLRVIGRRYLVVKQGDTPAAPSVVENGLVEDMFYEFGSLESEGLDSYFDVDHQGDEVRAEISDWIWTDHPEYFPPGYKTASAHLSDSADLPAVFEERVSGAYPGVRFDPVRFEYLIYLEVPLDQLSPADPFSLITLGGLMPDDIAVNEDEIAGTAMAGIVVGDDGMVRAVHLPERAAGALRAAGGRYEQLNAGKNY